MTRFKEVQLGWVVLVAVGLVLLLITILFSLQLGTRPITTPSYLLVCGTLGLSLAFAYRMQIEVTDEEVIITFGIGMIRRRIPITKIISITEVTNPWYYGWGMRIIPNGWLYNVSGPQAVELQLDTGRVVRIGTRRQAELAGVLRRIIRPPKP